MTTRTLATIPRPKPTWDEADLLRAAAVIADELSDYQPHTWTDVIGAVREVTEGGSRFHASKLAYGALTTYFDDAPMAWSGESGKRVVAVLPTPEQAQEVAQGVPCPTCGAPAGQTCVRRRTNGRSSTRVAKKWPHDSRLAAVSATARLPTVPERS